MGHFQRAHYSGRQHLLAHVQNWERRKLIFPRQNPSLQRCERLILLEKSLVFSGPQIGPFCIFMDLCSHKRVCCAVRVRLIWGVAFKMSCARKMFLSFCALFEALKPNLFLLIIFTSCVKNFFWPLLTRNIQFYTMEVEFYNRLSIGFGYALAGKKTCYLSVLTICNSKLRQHRWNGC